MSRRILSLSDRMLLAEWIMQQLPEAGSMDRTSRSWLQTRLQMPSGHGVDMTEYQSHVDELLRRPRQKSALALATEAEVLVLLRQADHLCSAARELSQALDRRIHERGTAEAALPHKTLLETLRPHARKRPVKREIKRLIREEPWMTYSNGQVA